MVDAQFPPSLITINKSAPTTLSAPDQVRTVDKKCTEVKPATPLPEGKVSPK